MKRNLTLRDYLEERYAHHEPELRCSTATPEEFEHWKGKFVDKLNASFGRTPQPVDLNPETVLEISLPEIRAQKIVFDSSEFMSVPAWVLIPEDMAMGERRPAVFLIPGHTGDNMPGGGRIVDHTSGKARVVGLNPDGTPCDTGYHNDIGQELVRAGFIVYCQDFLAFGERAGDPHYMRNKMNHVCNLHMAGLQMFGDYDLVGIHKFDLERGFEYLLSRPEVDAERVGMMGCSLGGMWTTWFTPLEKRIQAVVIACSYANLEMHIVGEKLGVCGAQVLHGHLNLGDSEDFPAAIAPRPMLAQVSKGDPGMSADDAIAPFKRVEAIYEMLGCEDRYADVLFEGGHEIHVPSAIDWFKRWLAT